jgi:membrane protein
MWTSSPIGFARRVLTSAYEDNILFLASALTFQALLAALPFVLLSLATLGYFVHAGEEAVNDVRQILEAWVPSAGSGAGDPFRQVERFLTGVAQSRAQLSVYGLPLFLWFSTRFFSGARSALNNVFDTQETRPWYVGMGVDFFLVVTALVLVVAHVGLMIKMADLPWVGRFAGNVSTFSVGVVLFFVIYTLSPTRRIPWDTALVASVVASLGAQVTQRLYVVYLLEFATVDRLISNTNVIALVLLVVWMYFTACVFLVGAEVGETYDMRKRQREQRAILT